MSWADGPLRAISIETTGGDEETARIVAVALVYIGTTVSYKPSNLLIDPGVPIPAEATARHSITTERARAEGLPPAEALQEIRNRLSAGWGPDDPVIGFDITSTLTVLDREMRRHLGAGLPVTGSVVDPHLLDLALDPRPGPRSLADTCRHYQVRHGRPHDPLEDAYAAARVAWRLARLHPAKVGNIRLPELNGKQIDWAKAHGRTWPQRLNSTADPRWNPAVLDAIHDQIRTDWEARLQASGPHPFEAELHIVNDTRAGHPYFTSIRCLPHKIGYDDAFLIALMGQLAHAMAADRIVIAWEPEALRMATWSRGMPLPKGPHNYVLHLLDVVTGTPTRLTKYPYIRPTRDGLTPFSWGATEVTTNPTEPLHPAIEEMIRSWREPSRVPKDYFQWCQEFRKVGYTITEALRPR